MGRRQATAGDGRNQEEIPLVPRVQPVFPCFFGGLVGAASQKRIIDFSTKTPRAIIAPLFIIIPGPYGKLENDSFAKE
jgi:hypothetical protein